MDIKSQKEHQRTQFIIINIIAKYYSTFSTYKNFELQEYLAKKEIIFYGIWIFEVG